MSQKFGWLQIIRLGVIQACLGSVVVLTTSTLNRIMVVEYALPALLPGLLVTLHYLVQFVRPRMGYAHDSGNRLTTWIVGGMAVLGLGGFLAAVSTVLMPQTFVWAVCLAIIAFIAIGLGVSAAGTSLLVLLAKQVDDERRAPAATTVWMMMIVGFIITAAVGGSLLDPYSPQRLLMISGGVSVIAFCLTCLAIKGIEAPSKFVANVASDSTQQKSLSPVVPEPIPAMSFKEKLACVWDEPVARRFTVFVFVSMLAYNAQDLILEPFAGVVFEFTPGQSTRLSSIQHSGVLLGMILVALACSRLGKRWLPRNDIDLRAWMIGGCLASGLAMAGLVCAGLIGISWPIRSNVFLLGVANGVFSIAAISLMMQLAIQQVNTQQLTTQQLTTQQFTGSSIGSEADQSTNLKDQRREGTRMGLWGAAQALAFGLGGLLGAGACDLARWAFGRTGPAYSSVFAFEAVMFVVAAWIAWTMKVKYDASGEQVKSHAHLSPGNEQLVHN